MFHTINNFVVALQDKTEVEGALFVYNRYDMKYSSTILSKYLIITVKSF